MPCFAIVEPGVSFADLQHLRDIGSSLWVSGPELLEHKTDADVPGLMGRINAMVSEPA
jgi:hypothetical protein